LEGELAIFCLDAELRKRSNGESGVCELMSLLCKKYAIEYPNVERLGVNYNDIRSTLTSMKGGLRLGKLLDSLVFDRKAPDVKNALRYFSLELVPEKTDKDDDESLGWLGLQLRQSNRQILVSSHQQDSPLRNIIMPGDEILAIDGFRMNDIGVLNKFLKGMANKNSEITYTHEGIIKKCNLVLPKSPQRLVKLEGKGNKKWSKYISTRQTTSNPQEE
jgi:predicted metalloprotease with PDZ domain